MKRFFLLLELVDHGLARLDFQLYGRTLESYSRWLNSNGRWANKGSTHAPLITWLPSALPEAEKAAARASAAREREVKVAQVGWSGPVAARDFVLFERSMEPALLGHLPLRGQQSIRQQRDADKLADFCSAIARVFFEASDVSRRQEASHEVAKLLTAKYGGGSVTSAIQWLCGKAGYASLQAVLCGDAELPGSLLVAEEEMMNNTKAKIGVFVDRLVQDAAASGLTWDEAISAFGLASKVTALMAAESGDGTKENCVALARNRFEEAFAQPIQVVFASSDLSALREVTDEQAKAVLDNTNIRIIGRFTH